MVQWFQSVAAVRVAGHCPGTVLMARMHAEESLFPFGGQETGGKALKFPCPLPGKAASHGHSQNTGLSFEGFASMRLYWYILDICNDHTPHRKFIPVHDIT